MKKVFLMTVMALGLVSNAAADQCPVIAQNAFTMGLALGVGSAQTSVSNITTVLSTNISADNVYNQFVFAPGTNVAALDGYFSNNSLVFGTPSLFNSNANFAGEINMAGKFGLGNSMFARLSAFFGYNGGFSQAQIPVTYNPLQIRDTLTAAVAPADPSVPLTSAAVAQYGSLSPIGNKTVSMKSGLGYGIMAGIGQETTWGAFAVEVGVVFRSFGFYFPSAIPTTAQALPAAGGIGVNGAGFYQSPVWSNAAAVPVPQSGDVNSDANLYNTYYKRFTQTGMRFGGDISFKITDTLSWGVSALVEFFGKKTVSITPNISSANVAAAAVNASDNSNSINANQIVNTNMLSSTQTASFKNVMTSVMLNLTYAIPVGNN